MEFITHNQTEMLTMKKQVFNSFNRLEPVEESVKELEESNTNKPTKTQRLKHKKFK